MNLNFCIFVEAQKKIAKGQSPLKELKVDLYSGPDRLVTHKCALALATVWFEREKGHNVLAKPTF